MSTSPSPAGVVPFVAGGGSTTIVVIAVDASGAKVPEANAVSPTATAGSMTMLGSTSAGGAAAGVSEGADFWGEVDFRLALGDPSL